MKDHPLTQAALLVLVVSAGIILEKWVVTLLPNNGITTPLKKIIAVI